MLPIYLIFFILSFLHSSSSHQEVTLFYAPSFPRSLDSYSLLWLLSCFLYPFLPLHPFILLPPPIPLTLHLPSLPWPSFLLFLHIPATPKRVATYDLFILFPLPSLLFILTVCTPSSHLHSCHLHLSPSYHCLLWSQPVYFSSSSGFILFLFISSSPLPSFGLYLFFFFPITLLLLPFLFCLLFTL